VCNKNTKVELDFVTGENEEVNKLIMVYKLNREGDRPEENPKEDEQRIYH
jgi:hypothetical protein